MKGIRKTLALVLMALMVLGMVSVASAEVDKSQTLIIYTNSGSNGRAEWLTEKATEAGYSIEVLFAGAGELANRIVAEKNNQIADMVFGLNTMEYVKLKNQDLLMEYRPVWADEVDETLCDPEGQFYPIVIQPLLLAYNTDVYTAETAPQDWPDLVKEEYHDKYTVLGLGGGTSRTIIASILCRYQDEAGEYGISEEGWDIITGYIQNGHIAQDGEDYFGNVVTGVRPMSGIWGSGYIQNKNELQADNLAYVTPEIGVPYVVEQVAVFKNSGKTDLAIDFINWFGSAEVQADWSAQFGSTPAHPDALATADAEVQEMMETVHPQEMDWDYIVQYIEQWMEKIELEIVP